MGRWVIRKFYPVDVRKQDYFFWPEVTLSFLSNLIGSSYDENNFPHKLIWTDTKVSKILKIFAIGLSANIKFSKTQLSEIAYNP